MEESNPRGGKMKIKVISKEKEYEGIVEEKVVTPFGTSGHINVGKKHTGKIMPVINLTNPEYKWVLSKEDLKNTIDACIDILKNKNLVIDSKLIHYQSAIIQKLKDRFLIEDLSKVIEILKENSGNEYLIKRIKETYSI